MTASHLRTVFTLSLAVLAASRGSACLGEDKAAADGTFDAGSTTETKAVERQPIYEEKADGEEKIAGALKRAKAEGKHVLIEWGGNWCGWCHKLHAVFTNDQQVSPILVQEYEFVVIDSRENAALLEKYGGKDTTYSYPYLTVLNSDGTLLTNQRTEPLEKGSSHNPEAVAAFLKKWQPDQLDAEAVLATAMKRAKDSNRRILLHVGTPYCGWCKILSRFLTEHDETLSRDFIDVRLDSMRMSHGEDVAERLKPKESDGIPWMVILDSSGAVLATSVGSQGNIGYPFAPEEIAHFISMLNTTKKSLTEDDLQALRRDLDMFRAEFERREKSDG